eukprot:10450749-Karenia_brevis.AAC.1
MQVMFSLRLRGSSADVFKMLCVITTLLRQRSLPIFYDNAYAADLAQARAAPTQPSSVTDALQNHMWRLGLRVTPNFYH